MFLLQLKSIAWGGCLLFIYPVGLCAIKLYKKCKSQLKMLCGIKTDITLFIFVNIFTAAMVLDDRKGWTLAKFTIFNHIPVYFLSSYEYRYKRV